MPKQPGGKKEATGRAVFNTNNDTEVSRQLGVQATGPAAFNTNNDTVTRQPGGAKEATGKQAFNTNKDLNN
ncbi:MAG: hypothetical protein ACOY4Q_00330 [Bacillota bacterium]